MAEPNVTIISASIPVLRGFVRNVRKRTESSPGAGAYIKTGDNSSRFYNRSVATAVRTTPKDQDVGSDSIILGNGQQDGDMVSGRGIALTTEISVEYEPMPQTAAVASGGADKGPATVEFEMDKITSRP